jgi:fructose-bisphosphate aldolase class II
MILTTIAEAVIYIKKLNEAGLYPQLLAIANGSSHGNIYDSKGKLKKQVSINIERTKEITKALRREGLNTRIAQHGITGTPYQLIYTQFPHGDILKGNVGTFWMNIAYEVIQTYNPKLYADIHKWTIKNYKKEAKKIGMKTDEQIFGRYGKKAIKQFFKRIYSLNKEIEKELEAKAYIEALKFIKAFKLKGSATIVREWIEKNNKTI